LIEIAFDFEMLQRIDFDLDIPKFCLTVFQMGKFTNPWLICEHFTRCLTYYVNNAHAGVWKWRKAKFMWIS